MTLISSLPPFLIDQIIGTASTSYVVIKLWLCGDQNFNEKLSKGVTFIDLKSHPLSACEFPRIVSQLQSLRHLSLSTHQGLRDCYSNWPEVVRTFPNTLESLSLSFEDAGECVWNLDSKDPYHPIRNPAVETTFSRGKSSAIEFETLFPRLRTLTLASLGSSDIVSGELFSAPSIISDLPSSPHQAHLQRYRNFPAFSPSSGHSPPKRPHHMGDYPP